MLRIEIRAGRAAGAGTVLFILLAAAALFYFTRDDGVVDTHLKVTSCKVGRYDSHHRWYFAGHFTAKPGTPLIAKVTFESTTSKPLSTAHEAPGNGPYAVVQFEGKDYPVAVADGRAVTFAPHGQSSLYVHVGNTEVPDFDDVPPPPCQAEMSAVNPYQP